MSSEHKLRLILTLLAFRSETLISILLWLLGWFPGIVYALYVIFRPWIRGCRLRDQRTDTSFSHIEDWQYHYQLTITSLKDQLTWLVPARSR